MVQYFLCIGTVSVLIDCYFRRVVSFSSYVRGSLISFRCLLCGLLDALLNARSFCLNSN